MTEKNQNLQFIQESLKSNKLSHAYIMLDKAFPTEAADLIMCKQDHTGCGSCSSCLKLKSGNHPDIMYIEPDGASIKIAQVESVQSFIHIRPFESNYKLIVFENAHLMTEQAQNRLLKVLEEPPEYVVIFFVTENMEALLETVRSRCQVIGRIEQGDFVKDETYEKAIDFALSLEFLDAGRIFEYSAFFKKDKSSFNNFLNHLSVLLRDMLVLKETGNNRLLHEQNLIILEERAQLYKLSYKLEKRKIIKLIFLIDELQVKLKANMNYELVMDKFLFQCIKD